jgi:NTP pyrophosphatase (non-canonical NTP hydrolase)
LLSEEAGEVIQAVAKINRFGLMSSYAGETNEESLFKEINDIFAVVEMLEESFGVKIRDDFKIQEKKDKINKFKLESKSLGFLE